MVGIDSYVINEVLWHEEGKLGRNEQLNKNMGICGSVVSWGTMLQAGRQRARFPM
jgi:hypothetical protein